MKTKKILLELPEQLHRDLKATASKEGSSIKETLLSLINNYVNKLKHGKNQ